MCIVGRHFYLCARELIQQLAELMRLGGLPLKRRMTSGHIQHVAYRSNSYRHLIGPDL